MNIGIYTINCKDKKKKVAAELTQKKIFTDLKKKTSLFTFFMIFKGQIKERERERMGACKQERGREKKNHSGPKTCNMKSMHLQSPKDLSVILCSAWYTLLYRRPSPLPACPSTHSILFRNIHLLISPTYTRARAHARTHTRTQTLTVCTLGSLRRRGGMRENKKKKATSTSIPVHTARGATATCSAPHVTALQSLHSYFKSTGFCREQFVFFVILLPKKKKPWVEQKIELRPLASVVKKCSVRAPFVPPTPREEKKRFQSKLSA